MDRPDPTRELLDDLAAIARHFYGGRLEITRFATSRWWVGWPQDAPRGDVGAVATTFEEAAAQAMRCHVDLRMRGYHAAQRHPGGPLAPPIDPPTPPPPKPVDPRVVGRDLHRLFAVRAPKKK